MLLLLAGYYLRLITAEIIGLTGDILSLTSERGPWRNFTLFSLLDDYGATALTSTGVWQRAAQAMLGVFVLGAPLAHTLSCLILWVVPLSARGQYRLVHVVEILMSLGSLEVFLVTVGLAILAVRAFLESFSEQSCSVLHR